MNDDTVVMTTLDNGTPRQRVVEAIRTAMKEGSGYAEEYTWIADQASRSIIQSLVNQQIDAHDEQLAESQEAMLVRRCLEKLEEGSEYRTLNMIAGDNTVYAQGVNIHNLLQNCRLDDDRFIELALTQENDSSDAKIVAVCRGDIAYPIASVIGETSKVILEQNDNSSNVAHRETILKLLLSRVRNKPLFALPQSKSAIQAGKRLPSGVILDKWGEWKARARNRFGGVIMTEEDYFFDPTFYSHTVPATYLYRQGLLRKEEGAIDDPYNAGMTDGGVNTTFKELETFLADPESYDELPTGCDCPPVWLALSRLPLKRQAEQALFDQLGISGRIQEHMGETTLEEERFIKQVQSMLLESTVFVSTYYNVNTGTNRAKLDVKACIKQEGTEYWIDIYAKSNALKDQHFPPDPQRTLYFNTLNPIIDRGSNNPEEAKVTITRFANTLKRLKPVQVSR
jgi:hypothetical protein